MEFGPVGITATFNGPPEGAASSVRNCTESLGSLQPTSFSAATEMVYSRLGRSPSTVTFGSDAGTVARDSLVRPSLRVAMYLTMFPFPLYGSSHVNLTQDSVMFTIAKRRGFSGASVKVCVCVCALSG